MASQSCGTCYQVGCERINPGSGKPCVPSTENLLALAERVERQAAARLQTEDLLIRSGVVPELIPDMIDCQDERPRVSVGPYIASAAEMREIAAAKVLADGSRYIEKREATIRRIAIDAGMFASFPRGLRAIPDDLAALWKRYTDALEARRYRDIKSEDTDNLIRKLEVRWAPGQPSAPDPNAVWGAMPDDETELVAIWNAYIAARETHGLKRVSDTPAEAKRLHDVVLVDSGTTRTVLDNNGSTRVDFIIGLVDKDGAVLGSISRRDAETFSDSDIILLAHEYRLRRRDFDELISLVSTPDVVRYDLSSPLADWWGDGGVDDLKMSLFSVAGKGSLSWHVILKDGHGKSGEIKEIKALFSDAEFRAKHRIDLVSDRTDYMAVVRHSPDINDLVRWKVDEAEPNGEPLSSDPDYMAAARDIARGS